MRLFFIIVTLFAFGNMDGQISRGDLEKMTSKGSTLLDNGRLEDAIQIFNEILTKDPTEGNALLLRARTKYELGAFKGAKKDCFAYLDVYGIDAEVAGLLGKIEKTLENYKQGLAYLKTALLFDPIGEEYLLDRASLFYDLGLDDQACEDWYIAKDNGSEIAERAFKSKCKSYKPKVEAPPVQEIPLEEDTVKEQDEDYTSNEDTSEEDEEPRTSNNSDESEEDYTSNSGNDDKETDEEDYTQNDTNDESNDNDEEPVDEEPVDEEEEEVEESYPLDDSVEEIYIDEELTIILAEGIGSRKLLEKPDIFILNDKSGDVVVNVCIDRLGRVVNPTLNENASTIQVPSLISLALRESSNFRFARSSRKSHCGTITYRIKGTE